MKASAIVMWSTFLVIILFSIPTLGEDQIVIIGAGLSGISAASKLIENGFNSVTVLEAEDRIGGRIHTIPFDDKFIDLGGQWVHGEKGNVIYELAKDSFEFGSSESDELYLTYLISNGSFADEKKIAKLADLADEVYQQSEDEKNYEGSFGDYFIEKFKSSLNESKYSDIEPTLADLMIDSLHKSYNGFFASSSWYDISVKVNANYDDAEGNQHLTWKDKGYKTAFDYITKKLPDPSKFLDVQSKIHFKKEVTNIKWQTVDGNVKIECKDGSTFLANHVIFTASLGVLKKRHESLFSPKLPSRKILSIENIAFGAVGKIFLEFEDPFWPKDSFIGYSFLWQDKHIQEAISTNKEWLLGVSGFDSVDSFPNLIETFITGEHVHTFENLSDQKIIDDCMWMFEKFLRKSLAKPTKMLRTKWLTNNNFLGTYSYFSVGTEKFNVTTEDLAESLKNSNGKPAVLFAGEATDIKFPSYAHGAVSSGWRAADELIEYINNK